MKVLVLPRQPAVVVAALGTAGDVAALVAAAAPAVGELVGCPAGVLPGGDDPSQALAALAGGSPNLGVVELPVDPGLALEAGGTWAEALGAWRQPTLLVIAAPQLETGWPAAGHALLRQWQVPLVGLLQWAGDWRPRDRRRDGLPWLGLLGGGDPGIEDGSVSEGDDPFAVALRLRLRLTVLAAERA